MELDIDFSTISKQFSEEEIKEKVKRAMEGIAGEWEAEAKLIVSGGSVDTGRFLNSIHYEMFDSDDEIGFTGYDGVDYGIHHEYGTKKHWVPFYYHNDTSQPILADWGKRVLDLTEEEMLLMGGIQVELKELMAFRKALIYAENQGQEIFNEVFAE